MTHSIVIAIPSYTGTAHMGTVRSLMGDVIKLMGRGDRVAIYDEAGGAEIDTARAQIVADFLASDASHLVMVDSDVCWQAGGLIRLIDAGHDVVAGVYPYRRDPISFPLHLLDDSTQVTVEAGGVIEVKAVPGGFLCITRAALEQMIARYPDLQFTSSKTENPCWALFDHVWEGRTRLSEDLSFCHRWRAIGGKIYVDPSIQMGHVGPKLFAGRLGEPGEEN